MKKLESHPLFGLACKTKSPASIASAYSIQNGGDSLNPAYYIPIFMLFLVLYLLLRSRKNIIAKKAIEKRQKGEATEMVELAKKFIDKECLIYSFDGNRQFEGIIKEVSDSAILVEKDGALEAINLDFVIRIREYPRNKNGKKKSVILD